VLENGHGDLEYIVVDAGSKDGSRDLIQKYYHHINTIIFEPDAGPSDGLNKGFAKAHGDIYGFLNSDDYLLPDALERVADFFADHPSIDVMSGHAIIVDASGRLIRHYYSDHFSLKACAYGQCFLMQPSTFVRATAFNGSCKFNPYNHSNWDAELWVELALRGAQFAICNSVLSAYRVYPESITGSAKFDDRIVANCRRMFGQITGREWRWYDNPLKAAWRVRRLVRNPRNICQRILGGSVRNAGERSTTSSVRWGFRSSRWI
jgi:glycosyltransferase involved in cell wall biosynthesis